MSEVTRLRDLGVGRQDMVKLDPKTIVIEKGFNVRDYRLPENHDHLEELKAQIKQDGVRQPLWVRFDIATKQAILVDGECRLRSVLELIKEGVEIESVPVLQVQGGNEAERLVLSMTANTGKPLSKWESGNGFKRLVGYGWTEQSIASRLGYKERFVKEALGLADADEAVKGLLSERAVTPSLALDHIRKHGSNASITLRSKVEEAKANGKKTATREKKAPGKSLEALVKAMLKETGIEKLEDPEYSFVEVSRKSLLALYKFIN
jgi:ParB-like chromosome segregation protein Spo0J